ncbi:hypothetical protein ACOMHN_000431 [Nucella lapillus]
MYSDKKTKIIIDICLKGESEAVVDYMVITWVDDMQTTFRRELWNHFQTLQEEGIRSNNHLESFHAAFNRTFHTVHPNIFIFVSGLKKRQDETDYSGITGCWERPAAPDETAEKQGGQNPQGSAAIPGSAASCSLLHGCHVYDSKTRLRVRGGGHEN